MRLTLQISTTKKYVVEWWISHGDNKCAKGTQQQQSQRFSYAIYVVKRERSLSIKQNLRNNSYF